MIFVQKFTMSMSPETDMRIPSFMFSMQHVSANPLISINSNMITTKRENQYIKKSTTKITHICSFMGLPSVVFHDYLGGKKYILISSNDEMHF